MATGSNKRYPSTPEDYLGFSIDDEDLIENIKPNLISFSLSDSYSSNFSPDIKTISIDESFQANKQNNDEDELDSSSDSIMFLLENPTKPDSALSNEETLHKVNVEPATCKLLNKRTQSLEGVSCEHADVASGYGQDDQRTAVNGELSLTSNRNLLVPERKSLSLHDLRRLPSTTLNSKSHISLGAARSQSMLTVSSVPKSKDSGFTCSLSFLSLNSGGKGYDHVQSKVRSYIKQIKEEDATRRTLKLMESSNKHKSESELSTEFRNSEETLLEIINKLESDVEDRNNMLLEMQENYNSLLLKYAEAENRIDRLRFKVIDTSIPELRSPVGQRESSTKYDSKAVQVNDPSCQPPAKLHASSSNTTVLDKSSELTSHKTEPHSQNRSLLGATCMVTDYDAVLIDSHVVSAKQNKKLCIQQRHGAVQSHLNPLLKPHNRSLIPSVIQETNFQEQGENGQLVIPSNAEFGRTSEMPPASDDVQEIECATNTTYVVNVVKRAVTNTTAHQVKEIVPYAEEHTDSINAYKQSPKSIGQTLRILRKVNNFSPESCIRKVRKWQDSLPPVEQIEPSCYGSLEGNASRSETCSLRLRQHLKKHSGQDSGLPLSELCNRPLLSKTIPRSSSQPNTPSNAALSRQHKTKDYNSDTGLLAEVQAPVRSNWVGSEASGTSWKLYQNTEKKGQLGRLYIDPCECWETDYYKPNGCPKSKSVRNPRNKPETLPSNWSVPSLNLDALLADTQSVSHVSSGIRSDSNPEAIVISCDQCSVFQGTRYLHSTGVPYAFHSTQLAEHVSSSKRKDNKAHRATSIHRFHNSCLGFDLNISGNNRYVAEYSPRDYSLNHKLSSQISADTSTSYKSIQLNHIANTRNTPANCDNYYDCGTKRVSEETASSFLSSLSLSSEVPQNMQTEEPDLCRRKLLGQQTRTILLKLLHNFEDLYHCSCYYDHKSANNTDIIEVDNTTVRDEELDVDAPSKAPNEGESETTRVMLSTEDCPEEPSHSLTVGQANEVQVDLLKCLDEVDLCAQQIKAHSDAIIRFLSAQMDIPTPRIAMD